MSSDPTPRRPDHEVHDELAVGWALHALEPEDESAFAGHLASCDRCSATVTQTHELMAALATDLPAAEPSEGLGDRLRAAVSETAQVPRPIADPARREPPPADAGPVPRRPTPDPAGTRREFFGAHRAHLSDDRPSWRRVVPNALVAAAVAAILALGTWNVVVTQDRNQVQAIAAAQADVLDSLLAPGTATIAPMTEDDGARVATVVARDGQAQVVTDGMAVNDVATSTYVLWGITPEAPVALGTFDVVSAGVDLRTVGSVATGLGGYSAYGISIEPGRQAPSEPTDIVANGQVSS